MTEVGPAPVSYASVSVPDLLPAVVGANDSETWQYAPGSSVAPQSPPMPGHAPPPTYAKGATRPIGTSAVAVTPPVFCSTSARGSDVFVPTAPKSKLLPP